MDQIFEEILAKAFLILTEGPQMVLMCRTAEGEILDASLLHITEGDHREEDLLLSRLEGKKLTHVLALWDGGTLDLPSLYFRRGLEKMCPGWEEALVLLQTGAGPMALPLLKFNN